MQLAITKDQYLQLNLLPNIYAICINCLAKCTLYFNKFKNMCGNGHFGVRC
jgi:hypothetical protein